MPNLAIHIRQKRGRKNEQKKQNYANNFHRFD
jgi:hypothetical protein